MSDPARDDTIEAIEADHEGWRIWRSEAGSGAWYGTRHDLNLSKEAMELGCARTVGAEAPEELRRLSSPGRSTSTRRRSTSWAACREVP